MVVGEVERAHLLGEGGIALVVAAPEMHSSRRTGADARRQGGHLRLGRITEGEMQAQQVGGRGEKFLGLEHAVEVGVVRLLEELRVVGESGRLVPVGRGGVALRGAAETECAGRGDGPALRGREGYTAHPVDLLLRRKLLGDVEAGQGVAVVRLKRRVRAEPRDVELEHCAAVLGQREAGRVLKHLVAESASQAGDDHGGGG